MAHNVAKEVAALERMSVTIHKADKMQTVVEAYLADYFQSFESPCSSWYAKCVSQPTPSIVNCLRRSILLNNPIPLNSYAADMPEFVDICRVSDIPIGEARMILVDDVAFGIFNVSGEFFAIDDAWLVLTAKGI